MMSLVRAQHGEPKNSVHVSVRNFYFLTLTYSLLLHPAGFFEVICKREEVIGEVDLLRESSFISGCNSVLFAFGEWYCYAVVFGFRRVIFTARVWAANRI